jgi:hypothetical protein
MFKNIFYDIIQKARKRIGISYIVDFVFFSHQNASEPGAECERGMAL